MGEEDGNEITEVLEKLKASIEKLSPRIGHETETDSGEMCGSAMKQDVLAVINRYIEDYK